MMDDGHRNKIYGTSQINFKYKKIHVWQSSFF